VPLRPVPDRKIRAWKIELRPFFSRKRYPETTSRISQRLEALFLIPFCCRYHCSQCQSLQDATRYTELRQLPPVLHFSLLRFVYDFSTMERKKSKHAIKFPTVLDMGRFLGTGPAEGISQNNEGGNIYELRGVLLHKGTSAYHGHYEAQVFDTL
jgi:uncharacterized UBP type Zn finger protein